MPLVRYHCSNCDHHFELLRSRNAEATVATCPKCQSGLEAPKFGLPARPNVKNSGATNCRGDGPPCGAPFCGRKSLG